MRKYPDSGEVYEVKTVENKIDISSDTQICIPLIIDLEEKKLIWTDIALHKNMRSNNNVLQNMSSLTLMSKSMTSLRKPHLYDLFDLHIQARGKKTKKKQNADTIFTEKNGITPFETEQIIAEFL